jgi:rubrerythrin
LHLALPALEALHKAWTSRMERTKYSHFAEALEAGVDKIVEYYEKTADSDAHVFALRALHSFHSYVVYVC